MLDLLARILFDCTFTYARECECGRSIGFGQDRYLTSISQTFILSFFIIITLMMSDVSEWPTNVGLRNTHTHAHVCSDWDRRVRYIGHQHRYLSPLTYVRWLLANTMILYVSLLLSVLFLSIVFRFFVVHLIVNWIKHRPMFGVRICMWMDEM